MYICMYVHVCMYICNVYMYACMYVYMHIYMHIYMHFNDLQFSSTRPRSPQNWARSPPMIHTYVYGQAGAFCPSARTIMAMSRYFTVIAPSLWNRLPPSARTSLLSSNLSTSLSLLKTCLFSWS